MADSFDFVCDHCDFAYSYSHPPSRVRAVRYLWDGEVHIREEWTEQWCWECLQFLPISELCNPKRPYREIVGRDVIPDSHSEDHSP